MNYQASLAAQLIELEQELKYAEAFALGDPVASANIARANNQLHSAFAAFNAATHEAGRDLSASEANAVSARLTTVNDILANPKAPVSGTALSTTAPVLATTQLVPTLKNSTRAFEVGMWVLGVIPGVVLHVKKNKARTYFQALDNRIKTNAAQIDVFLQQRAQVLRNCPGFTAEIDPEIARGEFLETRNVISARIDRAYELLIEQARAANNGAIPDNLQATLRADRNIQREIAAARTL